MAAGTFPEPGTEYGPCLDDCDHADCVQTKKDRATPCEHCGEPIGSHPFYNKPRDGEPTWNGHYVHAICELDHIQEDRA